MVMPSSAVRHSRRVYSGLVPISPYTTPMAASVTAGSGCLFLRAYKGLYLRAHVGSIDAAAALYLPPQQYVRVATPEIFGSYLRSSAPHGASASLRAY